MLPRAWIKTPSGYGEGAVVLLVMPLDVDVSCDAHAAVFNFEPLSLAWSSVAAV